MKLLVNAPTGQQEIITVGDGGGYFDLSRVLWDEREDGSMPEITLGGMVRAGSTLEFNQARMNEHDAALKPMVPQSVAPLQGLLALDAAGLADDYELWANAPERTFSERAFINRAQVWRRDDPLLQAGTGALGMTDAQLDQLFILAATL